MRNGVSTAFGSMVERLNPRERVLLGVMSFIALGLICFLVIIFTHRSLSGLQEQVYAQEELVQQLRATAPEIRARIEAGQKAGKQAPTECPALGTLIEEGATKAGMGDTVLEMVDQPEERVGSYVRKSVEVRLRRKPLQELSEFWALTVNNRAEYPVAITRLTVRRRLNEEDSYDVDMTVSCYEQTKQPAAGKSNGGRKGGSNAKGVSRNKGRP